MGVDYQAVLAFAAPLKRRVRMTPVTRYNERTGQPYQTSGREYLTYVGNSEVEFDIDCVPDDMWDSLHNTEQLFLAEDVGYFGIPLASVDPRYPEAEVINPTHFDGIEDRYTQLVKDVFGDDEYDPMVKALLAECGIQLIGIAH